MATTWQGRDGGASMGIGGEMVRFDEIGKRVKQQNDPATAIYRCLSTLMISNVSGLSFLREKNLPWKG